MIEMQKMVELAKQIAGIMGEYKHARVISHNDADGISSAAIICQALLRKGIPYHLTIVGRLDNSVVEMVNETASDSDVVIFCDMGSGQPEVIENVERDTIVIDHHKPVGDSPAKAMINPHMAGIDGAVHLCAATTTYLVAKGLDENNIDLAGLAIAGAVGDKQLFETANKIILDEAVEAGVVSVKKGLKVGSGDIADILENTPEPYLDITGDREKIDAFLDMLDIHGDIDSLNAEQLQKLTSTIALKLTKSASPEAIDAAIGDVYVLNKEVVRNVYDLVAIMNTCGKQEVPGLAVALCMKDDSALEEAKEITLKSQKAIIADVKKAEELLQKGKSIYYLSGKDLESTGMIASTIIRYVHPDMPFIAINEVEGIIKISGRGTRELVDKGLDLAYALRTAASSVGGYGGGHSIASGASIPMGRTEDFISHVDDIVGEQLN
ncbi:DHHA1 domain-containing protein [Methanococcoides methylutens]|uniref:Single-stranded-DNA-specific exonuclease RecJ n=1 Tax=Methanococcoides methylutens MM1 TaxID=1434104 RepID=A0A0E3SPL2_METMT|nr:DHH family phosphoesterase [Methanococcoides methylutens]AKB84536.1 Single-stranded-DNA-specific exonuclease RecJ [Methanococcoides methylutens MM1]